MSGYFYHERSLEEELLVQAASSGDLESLLNLKSKVGDIQESPSLQAACYEALQFAAQSGHARIVTELLQCVLNVTSFRNFREGQKRFSSDPEWPRWNFCGARTTSSPFHLAVKDQRHLQVVQEFVRFFQTSIRILDGPSERKRVAQEWFQGVVDWAVRWGDANILTLLLTHDPLLVPLTSLSLPVHLAAHHGHCAALEVLLQHFDQCNVPLFSGDGLGALHLAAQSGSLDVVKLLLDTAQMDVNIRSEPDLLAPLHMAANSGHVDVVNLLLESLQRPDSTQNASSWTVDLMARDCMGRTALHYAARGGHKDVVQQLLLTCATLGNNLASIADHDGLLALHMAARSGHVGVIQILRSHAGSCHSTQARQAININRRAKREYIIGRKGQIYPRPKLVDTLFWKTEGFTPLHFAARNGHEEAVRELLKEAIHSGDLLLLQDGGGFLAYDWMEVQERGETFLRMVEELEVQEDIVDRLKRASFCRSKMTSAGKLETVSEINEEKKAMQELQRAWEMGRYPRITMPIVQWLEDKEIGRWGEREYWLQCAAENLNLDLFERLLELPGFDHAPKGAVLARIVRDVILCPEMSEGEARLRSHGNEEVYERLRQSPKWLGKVQDFLVVLMTREGPLAGVYCTLLRPMLAWAQERHLVGLTKVLLDAPDLKQGLYEDRQVYLNCVNAMLVGVALIGGVAFQSCLQPPWPLGHYTEYDDSNVHAVGTFLEHNCAAFFVAMAALIFGAIQVGVLVAGDDHPQSMFASLRRLKKIVLMESVLLAGALGLLIAAFCAARFALPSYLRPPVKVQVLLCAVSLVLAYAPYHSGHKFLHYAIGSLSRYRHLKFWARVPFLGPCHTRAPAHANVAWVGRLLLF